MRSLQLTFAFLLANFCTGGALAGDRIVWGFEFISGAIDGDLIVLPGGYAILSGAVIEGNAIVHPTGAMTSNMLTSVITGSVLANGAETIALFEDIVDGDVNVCKSGNVYIYKTYIGRDVNLISNDVLPWIVVIFSDIKGSVHVINNNSAFDISIFNNVIGRNLHCLGNTPPAQITSPNYPDNKVGGRIRCADQPIQFTSLWMD